MTRFWLPLFLLLQMSLLCWGTPNFEEVPSALKAGNDRKALELAQKLPASYGAFYNQGLAWRNLGDLPRARAAFETALLYRPYDLSTRRRLQEVGRQLGEKVQQHDVVSTPWWSQSQAEILLLLPGLAMLGLGWRARRSGAGLPVGPTLAVWSAGLVLGTLLLSTAPPPRRAVVIDSGAQLLAAPSPENPGEVVAAGALVELLEERDHYLQIKLGDGKTGWLRRAQLQELAIPSSL